MKVSKKVIYFFILFALALVQMVLANDTSLSPEGDNVGPFKGTPPITMEKEVVKATITNDKSYVDAVFYLRNTANKSVTLLVGFPDEASSPNDGDYAGRLEDFKVWVNGRLFSYTNKKQIRRNKKPYEGDYLLWKVWEMTFRPKERKIVRNTYKCSNGTTTAGPFKAFRYILRTGATWKGNIGQADIIITLKGINPKNIINKNRPVPRFGFTTPNFKLQGNNLIWTFRNFKPGINAPENINIVWQKK
jgi:hypothetical protein